MKDTQLNEFKTLANKLAGEGKNNASLARQVDNLNALIKKQSDQLLTLQKNYNTLQEKYRVLEKRCNDLIDQTCRSRQPESLVT